MKKIILITIIFATVANFCLAKENKIKSEIFPKSRIGVTGVAGGILFDWGGGGGIVSYHKMLSRGRFLSINTGYCRYTSSYNEKNLNEIPLTVGINGEKLWFNGKFGICGGLELGIIYRNPPSIANTVKITFPYYVGLAFRLTENVSLRVIEKAYIGIEHHIDVTIHIGAGIVYSLPNKNK